MAKKSRQFDYVVVSRCVDGDTVIVSVDVGFKIKADLRVRLAGINAPELSTPEGKEAWSTLSGLLSGAEVLMTCYRQDPYGRWVAALKRKTDDMDISSEMIRLGVASPY